MKLYTFTLSHFSEKVRWSLSAAGIAFVEAPWTPFFHVMPAILSGGRTTVPILENEGKRIQDSTRILLWLDRHRGPLSLLPSDAATRKEALELEARFDEVGSHVVRYAYSRALDDSESVVRYWTLDSTPRQRGWIRRGFPLLRFIFRRKLRMSVRNVERSKAVIEAGLALLEARIASGRKYLAGDELGVADITAAALLAPLVCPDEHPIYGSDRYRAGVAPLIEAWRTRPAFEWVRGMYREHRGVWPRMREIRDALTQ
jgi:glutathione S-transferase